MTTNCFSYRIDKHLCCHCYRSHVFTAMGSWAIYIKFTMSCI